MKSRKFKLILVAINITAIILFLLFNYQIESQSTIQFQTIPSQVTSGYHHIYIKGAVNTEGDYSVSDNSTIEDIITQAGGFNNNTDQDLFYTLYTNVDLKTIDLIFVPFKSKDKLLINYASIKEISWFFNIDETTAKKLASNKPFLSLEELNLSLKNLKINIDVTKTIVI